MDEMENAGVPWGAPGTQPEWPPLRELDQNLYSFREELIREGTREYVLELLKFDYWLISNGLQQSCGDLFTTGLNSYHWNYQISIRLGRGEFHEMLRDRLSLNLDGLIFGHEPEKLLPFMREVIDHQGRMLSDAMHANLPEDYKQLHVRFNSSHSNILHHWNIATPGDLGHLSLSTSLAQQYRVVLMGLAGRAVVLTESERIPDATQYLQVASEEYRHLRELGNDIAEALRREDRLGLSPWREWEMKDNPSDQFVMVHPERYPLTCFTIRLMELADDATLTINLGGNAKQALDWFLANSERLKRFVQDTPGVSVQQRRKIATKILRNAVRVDEITKENEIIRSELSSDRVSNFRSCVCAEAVATDAVGELFKQAGAFRHVPSDADDAPEERAFCELNHKGPLIDPQENYSIYYEPLDGKGWARSLSCNAIALLCEALAYAPQTTAPLNSLHELAHAIEVAVENLGSQDKTVVVLAGDWGDALHTIYFVGSVGRYRDHPILLGPTNGNRQLYVVDTSTWGTFVRAPFSEGEELRIDIEPVSHERAQELLQSKTEYFPNESDDKSRIRKLQTYVKITVGVRHGFQAIDHRRARRINPNPIVG